MSHTDPDAPLRDDVRLLGEILGEVIRARAGARVFETVETVRALAKSFRGGRHEDFDRLRHEVLEALSSGEALPVARAFGHFLGLANIAEQHHRIRRRRHYLRNPEATAQAGSFLESFTRLLAGGLSADRLREALEQQRIELVLTAHPTEVSRRTLLLKQNRIADLLAKRDRPDLTGPEEEEVVAALRRTVLELWETDEVRRDRPSPLDEVRWGLAVFENTLWDAVPRFLRSLDLAARSHLAPGASRPLSRWHFPPAVALVRFGSWMGGDRDGNPNVTAEVTWRACLMARWVAAGLYLREIDALRTELSMSEASEELRVRAEGAREPYRAVLRDAAARLRATQQLAETLLGPVSGTSTLDVPGVTRADAPPEWLPLFQSTDERARPYASEDDLRELLDLCDRSLTATGNEAIAQGRLLDLRRRLEVFGLVLAPVDVRQDAGLHDQAMDAITRQLGATGCWSEWDEAARLAFLEPYLMKDGKRLPLDIEADAAVREVFATFRVLPRIPRRSLGAYVITMASRASDVLAVLALQRASGIDEPLRCVPLFETGRDLQNAGQMLLELLRVPGYRAAIGGRQEVMVGYSDSSKDIGRFSAGWLLYKAQEAIVAACRDAGIQLTIFHGRGGSVGRGGGPTHLAIRSLPTGAVNGSVRVTEQGEMIQAHWGLPDIAVRTLEVYATAVLEATVAPAPPPRAEWREQMDALSDAARASYRSLVYEQPKFVEYFRTATPEVEIGQLNIGSRPARRSPGTGVGSLRAIPWQFAWTQTRLLLASWLGLDEALGVAASADGRLREMYGGWPYFQVLLDLMHMVLAKADPAIAAEYDRVLVPSDLRPVGEELRRRLALARERVLAVTGHRELLETNHVLKRSIAVRNPYVDPINLLQVELLRRLRDKPGGDEALWTAFAVTVSGIAAGMRNTG